MTTRRKFAVGAARQKINAPLKINAKTIRVTQMESAAKGHVLAAASPALGTDSTLEMEKTIAYPILIT